MANLRVLIYKLESRYLAYPRVLHEEGGKHIDFFNSTEDSVRVTIPSDAVESKADSPKTIPPGETRKIKMKSKGDGKFRPYAYILAKDGRRKLKLQKLKLKKTLDGASDPILILEN